MIFEHPKVITSKISQNKVNIVSTFIEIYGDFKVQVFELFSNQGITAVWNLVTFKS